jgi:hypothetical protein
MLLTERSEFENVNVAPPDLEQPSLFVPARISIILQSFIGWKEGIALFSAN